MFYDVFRLFFFVLQWLNGQKLVESLVSLIDPEIDEEVSSLSFFFSSANGFLNKYDVLLIN